MTQDILKALSNINRLQLILCLSASPKNVTELIATCTLSQSAVSQHLQKLKQAGLVNVSREGKEIYYSLKHEGVVDVSSHLINFIQEVTKK